MTVELRGPCTTITGWTEMPPAEQMVDCAGCPVRDACLAYALDLERGADLALVRHHVVYGGKTGRDRAKLIADYRRGLELAR